jgi:uncharacterized lipoprotein YddW (UPF0748 family)
MKLATLAAMALSLFASVAATAAEMRVATVLTYDTINTTTAIQNTVDQIANLKYNAIAVHARFRGDATYFPNKTNATYPNNEPRSSAAGSIDVLQEFITRGKAKGLKIFAYVNVFCVTDGKGTDSRSNHVINTQPGWITYFYNGGSPIRQTITHDDEGIWLDPGIPAVRSYHANIVGDIMRNYSVDGIMIDRIRYPQTSFTRANKDFGYHPTAVAAFNSQYAKTGTPSPSDTQWQSFRREQVNKQVEEIYNRMLSINPQSILLAFPIGCVNDAVNFNYQDWPTWMNRGIIDGCIVQIYRDTNTDFTNGCNEHLAAYSGQRLLGVATKAWISGLDVDGQINIARTKGFDGVSPFRHGVMQALGYFTDLNNVFTTTDTWPAMPWKSSPEYVVDNTDSGFAASTNWFASTSTAGYLGSNYRTRATASVSDSAAWNVNLPAAGNYEVFARWTAGSNRPTTAPYVIAHSGGSTTVNVNQTINNATWVSLGTFNFAAGNATRVRLSCWTTLGKYVVADGVKLVKR